MDNGAEVLELWVQSELAIPGFEYGLLSDLDQDGLPSLIEQEFRTSDGYSDTDFDGWSDITEIMLGADPRVSVSHPDGLVFDGSIGDWFDLIPKLMKVDTDESLQSCPDIDIFLLWSGCNWKSATDLCQTRTGVPEGDGMGNRHRKRR